MRRLALLDDHQRLLVRSIRTTEIPNVLERGTERNGNSLYRDRVLEEDFGFTPDMYICAFPYSNDEQLFKDAVYSILRAGATSCVIYDQNQMVPHFEAKYDFGMDTACTFSFKNFENRGGAVLAVIRYEGIYAIDIYEYGYKLLDSGLKTEAYRAFERFIKDPPKDWSVEEVEKYRPKIQKELDILLREGVI